MFLSLKTLYRKRTVIWPFYFYTIIRTLSAALLSINDKSNKNMIITPISTYRRLLIFIEFKILIVLTEILKTK